jgi:hypothetical protein
MAGKKEVERSVDGRRINLDIDYANNSSFMYDLWIMASTLCIDSEIELLVKGTRSKTRYPRPNIQYPRS